MSTATPDTAPAAKSAPAVESGKPATSPAGPSGGAPSGDEPSRLATRLVTGKLPIFLAALLVVVVSAVVTGNGAWPSGLVYDVKTPLDEVSNWLTDQRDQHWLFLYFLLHISNSAEALVDNIYMVLSTIGWIGVTGLATLLSWYVAGGGLHRRSLRVAGITVGTFAVCGVLNLWDYAMATLSLMIVAVAVAAVVGLLLGMIAGLSERGDRILRPVFDTMQVMPAFAYLLPLVLLFGIGSPAALVATVIYAAPPMARLTSLGLRNANPAALEASASLGATPWQRLRTARLPLARKEMLLGLNQTIMMALGMVVLASMIGAGGLGDKVYQGLSKDNFGMSLIAGVAIVLIAIWLDRATAAAGEQLESPAALKNGSADPGPLSRLRGWPAWTGLVVLGVVAYLSGPIAGQRFWPSEWTVRISSPITKGMGWITDHVGSGVPVVGGTDVWAANMTTWVLNPMRDALQATPWWSLLLLVAVLAWLAGSWRAAVTGVLSLGVIGVMGTWPKSMDTLAQVIVALVLTLILGVAIGTVAARSERFMRIIRPVLDVMQTMPQFVYLVPVVALVGVGRPAAIAAAVVYALPAVVRITAQGLRSVDPAAMEASRSLGSTTWQQLRQVQLPLARRSLLLAVNQGVVLVLAIVVIGGLVGGGALGYDVVYGLQKSDLGVGLTAGISIVCLGLMLDRLTQSAGSGKSGK
ncbi:ABC transporter permease subunit [Streptomyces sp. HNM0574]|uniref:ABC transporter permease n=1 Tax=Streptomyces sp. HNM0574 TaxID=2714954 RepID=UPI00146AD889|nr:ABC transporter permease subunit [Streptomyces sp. HNM0574]NLU66817.1 ABC transporter permease subunit [Streptomyces sp. HNM0574]